MKIRGDRYLEYDGARNKAGILEFARTEHKDDHAGWKKIADASAAAEAAKSEGGEEEEEQNAGPVTDTHSLVLGEDNFDSQLAGKTAVVEFYAPWCGHCKELAPKWAAAAAEGAAKSLVFGKVDVDEAPALGQRFKVEGFPTILKIRNAREYIEYEGERNKASILAFASKTHGDKEWQSTAGGAAAEATAALSEQEKEELVETLTAKNFDTAMKANPSVVWVVDFYAPWCGHCKKLAPEWTNAAAIAKQKGSTVRFAKVDTDQNEELSNRFDVTVRVCDFIWGKNQTFVLQ